MIIFTAGAGESWTPWQGGSLNRRAILIASGRGFIGSLQNAMVNPVLCSGSDRRGRSRWNGPTLLASKWYIAELRSRRRPL